MTATENMIGNMTIDTESIEWLRELAHQMLREERDSFDAGLVTADIVERAERACRFLDVASADTRNW